MSEAPDRQVEKTRAALMTAFTQLHFAQGYARTTISDVVKRANVGRSTFYEHFKSKEDILSACMARFFSVFAQSVGAHQMPLELPRVLAHLWENRRLTDAVFTGAPRVALGRVLAGQIERRLEDISGPTQSAIPRRLSAVHIAEAQLSLVEAWLRGRAAASPDIIAHALHVSGTASARALITD